MSAWSGLWNGLFTSQDDFNEIMEIEQIDADQFACRVLKAEGFDPELSTDWRRKMRAAFAKQMGGNSYDRYSKF